MKIYFYLNPRIISETQSYMLCGFLEILELYKKSTKDAELDKEFLACAKILFDTQIN